LAGQSSTRLQPTPEQSRPRISGRAPSLRTAVIVFLGLLILFRWLHLILALQLASTGRQIQIATEELQKIERHNTTLVQEISEAESPTDLAQRAIQEGYKPGQPIYVRTSQPLAQPPTVAENLWGTDQGDAGLRSTATSLAPWEALAQEVDAWARVWTAP
jgi:cell division protein FtsB